MQTSLVHLLVQTYKHIHDTVERRIPLLGQSVGELKQRIESVEPEFRKLNDILHQFKDEIITMRDRRASSVASSLRSHIANLDQTFESDFKPYQPELKFFDFLVITKESLEESFTNIRYSKERTFLKNPSMNLFTERFLMFAKGFYPSLKG